MNFLEQADIYIEQVCRRPEWDQVEWSSYKAALLATDTLEVTATYIERELLKGVSLEQLIAKDKIVMRQKRIDEGLM